MSLGSKIDTAIDRMFGIASAAQNWNDSLNYTFASLVNVVNASRQKNPANPYRKSFAAVRSTRPNCRRLSKTCRNG